MGALYYRYRVLWAHFRRWYGPRHTLLKTLYPPLPCGMQILIQHCQFHCYLILHCITTRETRVATMSALCISRDSWSMTSSGFGHDSIFDTMLYLGYLWTNCHGDRTKPSRTCTPRTLTPGHIPSPPPLDTCSTAEHRIFAVRKGLIPTTAQALDEHWDGGGWGEAVPISDINFDKYTCTFVACHNKF